VAHVKLQINCTNSFPAVERYLHAKLKINAISKQRKKKTQTTP